MSMFQSVDYDELSNRKFYFIKNQFEILEKCLHQLSDGRSKSLALTHLEEAFMWMGKSLRDEQISRSLNASLQRNP